MEFFEKVEFKPIECPKRGGIDFPCVICQECEIGTPEVILEGDMLIEKTVNSAIVSIPLELEDDFEEMMLKSYLEKIGTKKSFIMKQPAEGYQVSFFIDSSMVKTRQQRKQVEEFILNFQRHWKSLLSRLKSLLNKWEREAVNDTLAKLPK